MLLKYYLKLRQLISNERGDLNIQYLGIAALSVVVLAAVILVGGVISGKWDQLVTTITAIDLTP